MQGILQTLVLVRILGTTAAVNAAAFRSYATVLDVQPIVETYYEPVTREVCAAPDAAAREFTALAASIGEDIRHQLRLWQAQRSCSMVTERQARERVTAYRVTYRYRGHSMSDPAKYRTREEVQKMRDERDPIEQVRDMLLTGKHASEDDLKTIDKEIKAIVNEAAEFSKESPEPALEELWTDIYATEIPQEA